MLNLIIAVGAFLVGFWGYVTFFTSQLQVPIPFVTPNTAPENSPIVTTFRLQAPSRAMIGSIQEINGEARIEKRGSQGPVDLRLDGKIIDGEAVSTGLDSNVVLSFENGSVISVNSGSRVSFSNTQPTSFLAEQSIGTVVYTTKNPTSVRCGVVLIQVTGEVLITYLPEAGSIEFETRDGEATLSWINNQNGTEVVKVPKEVTGELDIANDKVTLDED